MAMPQRMISEEFSRKIGRGDLLMNHFPFHATTRTSSANALITDSAAAATAIACGEKTNNHMVGVSPSGKKLQSVAEAARDKGKKVGIIATHGYDGNYATEPFEVGIKRLCMHSNLKYIGMYSVQDNDNLVSFQTHEAIEGVKAFARRVVGEQA